jgi:hypothetical protein
MAKKKKNFEKLVFIVIILIFAFSSVLAYTSVSIKAPVPELVTPENQEKAKTNKDLLSKGLNPNQKMAGVIHKLEAGTYSEGTHFIEASGITLAILEADSGVNLDSYIDKNVQVWGDVRQVAEGDGAFMKVKEVKIAN